MKTLTKPASRNANHSAARATLETPAARKARVLARRKPVDTRPVASRKTLRQLERWHALYLSWQAALANMLAIEADLAETLNLNVTMPGTGPGTGRHACTPMEAAFDLNNSSTDFGKWLASVEAATGVRVS